MAKRYLGPVAGDSDLGARLDPTAEIAAFVTDGTHQATMDAQGTPAYTALGVGALNQWFVGKHSESGPAASASGRSVARLGANLRGATGLTNSGNPNGYVDFQVMATATDSAAPMDFRIALPGTGVTPTERLRVLSAGGVQVPEMTPPAGVADNIIFCARDNGGTTEFVAVTPDSTVRVVAPLRGNLRFVIDGGGSAITTGAKKVYLTVPYTCTITGWTLVADVSGSIVLDLWKDTYANFPPVVGDSITASAKPTLSSVQKNTSTTLTGWTTAVTAGDVIEVNVDSATTVTKVTLDLAVLRAS
jgi:hypothetical protein